VQRLTENMTFDKQIKGHIVFSEMVLNMSAK